MKITQPLRRGEKDSQDDVVMIKRVCDYESRGWFLVRLRICYAKAAQTTADP